MTTVIAEAAGPESALEAAVGKIEKSLAMNPQCGASAWVRPGARGIAKGPSGGPEILALVRADDSFFGYWFGHVMRHPAKPRTYVSLLVRSDALPNADLVPLLFRRFHHWMKVEQKYYPCTVQNCDDAYNESISLEGAASNLVRMIRRFDIAKRCPDEDGAYYDCPVELRILDVYEFVASMNNNGYKDKDGRHTPLPMPATLRLVEDCQ
jgi:hypothetical protein